MTKGDRQAILESAIELLNHHVPAFGFRHTHQAEDYQAELGLVIDSAPEDIVVALHAAVLEAARFAAMCFRESRGSDA